MDASLPNAQTPKRQGDPLDAPPTKEARASRDIDEQTAELNLKDYGLPSWDDKTIRLDVTPEGQELAINHPLLGWPDFAHLCGNTGGAHLIHEVFGTASYRKLRPKTPYKRVAGEDPVSIAQAEAGAIDVNQREFCTLDGSGLADLLLATSHFLVYQLPTRGVRAHLNILRQWGIRLGPKASGEETNHLIDPRCMPPELRKSSPREVRGFLRARSQYGLPVSMQTDACLVFCAMGYQS